MVRLVEAVFKVGPLLFAALFLFPLFVQIAARLGWDGAAATLASAGLAALLGVQAQWRGRWV